MPVRSRDAPDVLKPIKGLIARGEEMSRVQTQAAATTAYYAFKMAMSLGIKLNDKTPPVKKYLSELMTDLETAKNNPLVVKDEVEAKRIVEEVAMNAFKRADDVDRRGEADKKTAMTYYTAQTLFEVLRQFSPDGELDPDTKAMCKYAKWKATDIMKAINEGRKPTPGDAGGNLDAGEDGGDDEHHHDDDHDVPTATASASVTAPPAVVYPPPSAASSGRQSFSGGALPVTRPAMGGKLATSLSKGKKDDTIEYIKYAKAAVESGDIALAAQRLESALALLYE